MNFIDKTVNSSVLVKPIDHKAVVLNFYNDLFFDEEWAGHYAMTPVLEEDEKAEGSEYEKYLPGEYGEICLDGSIEYAFPIPRSPTVIRQSTITRDDCRRNPRVVYIFGDNLLRKGYGGQARSMRDEDNAVGIVTKRKPDNKPGSFFTEEDLEEFKPLVDADLALLKKKIVELGATTIVISSAGIGTGLSGLEKRAPSLFNYLTDELNKFIRNMRVQCL